MSLLLLYRPSNAQFIPIPEGVAWREEEKENIRIAKKYRKKLDEEIKLILKIMDEMDEDDEWN